MSELINNRQMKQEKLKEIILKLHNGASVEDVKAEFDSLTVGVSPSEITQMEQALVDGGLPVQDIQRLCDVHASVFKGSIEDIHKEESEDLDEWHPASVLKEENRALEEIVESVIKRLERKNKQGLLDELRELAKIDIHYRRKENVIFPYMEKYNITAPPQVMWGVDDEIRTKIHDITNWVEAAEDISSLEKEIYDMTAQISEMIFKEEEIMLPMVMDVFTQDEWLKIDKAGDEIGYIFYR